MADDGRVHQEVERLGRQCTEGGDGQPQDLAVDRAQIGDTIDGMRTYRFYGFTSQGAGEMAAALNEDGMQAVVREPGQSTLPGWVVVADDGSGDTRSEGLLESLAHFFGGVYEGENLSGA